ncbi:hypothetical protein COB72_08445 [bacterium]|nr:MAG: hypothetical protein COB72_08445 [bacterium]
MKTAIKIIAVLFVLVVLGIVGLVVFGLGQIDKLAKTAVEYGGTYAMGVETTVDTMDVALTKGTVEMGGLSIDNPSGFDTGHFFTLANTSASFDLESISADAYIVPTIHLIGIDIILDKGQDPSNYNQILKNLARFESDDQSSSDQTKAGKNVIIKSLILEDINIHVANMPGVSLLVGDVAINIPRIELNNIGEKESMKAGDIFNLVIKTVLAAAVESGGGIIPSDVLGELVNGLSSLSSLSDLGIDAISDLNLDGVMSGVTEQLGDVTEDVQAVVDDTVKEAEKAVEDVTKEITDTVDDAVKDVSDKLNNIFGKKKKDDG